MGVILRFMKVAAPSLLPLLRSKAQGEILAWVLLTPGEHSIADISRATGTPESTVLREIDRLSATGFVTERRQGRTRLIASNPENVATQPLTALLAVTFGPVPLMRERLSGVIGLEYAAIFGSWAARATGVSGAPPRDIDLLVVGGVSRTEVWEIAEQAGSILHRPVNATVIDHGDWLAGTSPFVATLRNRPLVTLIDRL
jgi:DNA-binding transcriptional ArsR family regulator